MNWKRGLGIALLFVGIGLSFVSKTLTGAVIGFNPVSYLGILGIFVFIAGIIILYSSNLEDIAESGTEHRQLIRPLPGKGIKGGYVRLSEVLRAGNLISNKVDVEVRGNQIYRTSNKSVLRPIQGLKIEGDQVIFLGQHYTNENAAHIIEDDQSFLRKNLEDPYVYFSEPIDTSQKTTDEIRHLIGSAGATEVVEAKVSYPVDNVYLKFEKGRPTHIAIDGDVTPEHLIRNKGKYVSVKKIKE